MIIDEGNVYDYLFENIILPSIFMVSPVSSYFIIDTCSICVSVNDIFTSKNIHAASCKID